MTLFPLFLDLRRRPCLVVGAGRIATEKIGGLLAAGARVHVVAPRGAPRIRSWARRRKIRWERREFRPADLDGAFLVVVATSCVEVNDAVFREARRRNVLANVVDDPPRCDFYYPAVVRRGPLQIAISTGGRSPALAKHLRVLLTKQFGAEYGPWVERLGAERHDLFTRISDRSERLRRLRQMVQAGPTWARRKRS